AREPPEDLLAHAVASSGILVLRVGVKNLFHTLNECVGYTLQSPVLDGRGGLEKSTGSSTRT
ncbi:MAG: hypothetical protein OXD46_08680, partial [Chloroflexi bacterium]|nr:hypothetical protein [Chloroflexota bacterium]